ncbi:MAG: PEGA domain-containing protein [Lentimonas sp.]
MKFKSLLPLTCVFTALISVFAGCASMQLGAPQEVIILSFPNEASVYVDGEAKGITPMVIKLPRKVTHEVRLEKHGYNSSVKYFASVPNDKSENFITFGLPRDLGYYVDLEPSTMQAEMQSGLVPNSIGADPFEKMAQRALQADRQLETGEITPHEHKVIIEQIIEFFEQTI